MPEHVHLVIALEDVTAETFLRSLKPPFASEVLDRWRELRTPLLARLRDRAGTFHFWQKGGGYDRNVVGEELLEKIGYSHRNPITRGLVKTSVDWKWSSARRFENRSDAVGPAIAFDLIPRGSGPLT
jgi:putative transposase